MSTQIVSVAQLLDWLRSFGTTVNEQTAYLTELDSAIGDADHGTNMTRGMNAVLEQLDDATGTIDVLFKKVGMTLVSNVGGASGPLYGTFFMKFGTAAGAKQALTGTELTTALRAGLDGVLSRGKAEPGDKTMVDCMLPAIETLEAALTDGESMSQATQAAATAAATGRDATIPLVARKGRASYLGERSAGHLDPGATSAAYLFEALATAVAEG